MRHVLLQRAHLGDTDFRVAITCQPIRIHGHASSLNSRLSWNYQAILSYFHSRQRCIPIRGLSGHHRGLHTNTTRTPGSVSTLQSYHATFLQASSSCAATNRSISGSHLIITHFISRIYQDHKTQFSQVKQQRILSQLKRCLLITIIGI